MAMPTTTALAAQFEHVNLGGRLAHVSFADTAISYMYREWKRHHAFATGSAAALSDADYELAISGLRAIEKRVLIELAESPTDVLVKLLVLTCDGQDFADNAAGSGMDILAEARRVIERFAQ